MKYISLLGKQVMKEKNTYQHYTSLIMILELFSTSKTIHQSSGIQKFEITSVMTS